MRAWPCDSPAVVQRSMAIFLHKPSPSGPSNPRIHAPAHNHHPRRAQHRRPMRDRPAASAQGGNRCHGAGYAHGGDGAYQPAGSCAGDAERDCQLHVSPANPVAGYQVQHRPDETPAPRRMPSTRDHSNQRGRHCEGVRQTPHPYIVRGERDGPCCTRGHANSNGQSPYPHGGDASGSAPSGARARSALRPGVPPRR